MCIYICVCVCEKRRGGHIRRGGHTYLHVCTCLIYIHTHIHIYKENVNCCNELG